MLRCAQATKINPTLALDLQTRYRSVYPTLQLTLQQKERIKLSYDIYTKRIAVMNDEKQAQVQMLETLTVTDGDMSMHERTRCGNGRSFSRPRCPCCGGALGWTAAGLTNGQMGGPRREVLKANQALWRLRCINENYKEGHMMFNFIVMRKILSVTQLARLTVLAHPVLPCVLIVRPCLATSRPTCTRSAPACHATCPVLNPHSLCYASAIPVQSGIALELSHFLSLPLRRACPTVLLTPGQLLADI